MFSVDACCTTSQSMPVSNIVPVRLCRTAYNAIGIRTSKLIDYLRIQGSSPPRPLPVPLALPLALAMNVPEWSDRSIVNRKYIL